MNFIFIEALVNKPRHQLEENFVLLILEVKKSLINLSYSSGVHNEVLIQLQSKKMFYLLTFDFIRRFNHLKSILKWVVFNEYLKHLLDELFWDSY